LHQLGKLAEDQQKWEDAVRYVLQANAIFFAYQDQHNFAITLNSLIRIWQTCRDSTVPQQLAALLKISQEEVQALLEQIDKMQ